MTDDLVKQLRAAGRAFIDNQYSLYTRAADRIEDLQRNRQHWQDAYVLKTKHEIEVRARNKELEAALRYVDDKMYINDYGDEALYSDFDYKVLYDALAGEKKDG